MITLDDYHSLKRELEEKKKKKDQAEGALNEVIRRLKEESGCSSLKDAKLKLAKLSEEREELLAKYQKEKELFDTKWKEIKDKWN